MLAISAKSIVARFINHLLEGQCLGKIGLYKLKAAAPQAHNSNLGTF
jgi:hypothetical protein